MPGEDNDNDLFLPLRRLKLHQPMSNSAPCTPILKSKQIVKTELCTDGGTTTTNLRFGPTTTQHRSMSLVQTPSSIEDVNKKHRLSMPYIDRSCLIANREKIAHGKSFDEWKMEKDFDLIKTESEKKKQLHQELEKLKQQRLEKEKLSKIKQLKWIEAKNEIIRRKKMEQLQQVEWNKMERIHLKRHEKYKERFYNSWLVEKHENEISKELLRLEQLKTKPKEHQESKSVLDPILVRSS